jgi:GNAT superfamily N-acetyltransferase
MEVTIRRAEDGDAAVLAILSGQLGYPITAAEMAARIVELNAEPEQLILVAETAAQGVVGWAHAFVIRPLMEVTLGMLWGLVVDESCRGQGIGKQLVAAVESWSQEQGCEAVVLHSHTGRLGAHAFYRGIGYRDIKTQLFFWKDLESVD